MKTLFEELKTEKAISIIGLGADTKNEFHKALSYMENKEFTTWDLNTVSTDKITQNVFLDINFEDTKELIDKYDEMIEVVSKNTKDNLTLIIVKSFIDYEILRRFQENLHTSMLFVDNNDVSVLNELTGIVDSVFPCYDGFEPVYNVVQTLHRNGIINVDEYDYIMMFKRAGICGVNKYLYSTMSTEYKPINSKSFHVHINATNNISLFDTNSVIEIVRKNIGEASILYSTSIDTSLDETEIIVASAGNSKL